MFPEVSFYAIQDHPVQINTKIGRDWILKVLFLLHWWNLYLNHELIPYAVYLKPYTFSLGNEFEIIFVKCLKVIVQSKNQLFQTSFPLSSGPILFTNSRTVIATLLFHQNWKLYSSQVWWQFKLSFLKGKNITCQRLFLVSHGVLSLNNYAIFYNESNKI